MKNQKQRKEVRERLSSEEGENKYKQWKIEVEPVFGQIKYNNRDFPKQRWKEVLFVLLTI
jgi:hypothetical protein